MVAPDGHCGLSGPRRGRKPSAKRPSSEDPGAPLSLRQLEPRKLRSAEELEMAENSKSRAPGTRLKPRDLQTLERIPVSEPVPASP
jgi:hypothetical protein